MKRVLDAYTTLTDGPLKTTYTAHTDLTFLGDNVAEKLDVDYLLNRSGRKPASPMLYELAFGDFKKDGFKADIADIIYHLYGDKWNRLYSALTAEYNPLDNYNMTEKVIKDETTTTFGKTIDFTDTTSYGKELLKDETTTTFGKKLVKDDTTTTYGKTNTRTDALKDTDTGSIAERDLTAKDSEKVTPGISTTIDSGTYAYNEAAVLSPESQQTETKSGFDVKEKEFDATKTTTFNNKATDHTGTQTSADTGSDTVEHEYEEGGSDKSAHEYQEGGEDKLVRDYGEGGSEKQEHDYEFTRAGNIGVTTSQQMLESEIELRKKLFYKEVYSDLDYVLALQAY